MIDYVVRMACSLIIAAFVWLFAGVVAVHVTQRMVSLPHLGLLALWVCTFVALELAGVWKGAEDND